MLKITKPALIVDRKKAIANIQMMAEKARRSNFIFRPHFKTHISAEIGEWFRQCGVSKITVSSIDMAIYFAGHDWNDITIAFPVNILQVEVLKVLSQQVKLTLVVESAEVVNFLRKEIAHSVNIMIKIDTGYHRTGIWHEHHSEVKKVMDAILAPHLFKGFLAHFGHTYKETERSAIQSIAKQGMESLNKLRSELHPEALLSIGDTPTCSVVDDFTGVDEIRPGNFVFYDVMQQHIGSCELGQVAVILAAPVVAIHADREELVVHGGAVHLSKDQTTGSSGQAIYGIIVKVEGKTWSAPLEGWFVKSLSQEHGIVSFPQGNLDAVKVGDLLGILPVHSCLTAGLMREYYTLRGEKITTMNI